MPFLHPDACVVAHLTGLPAMLLLMMLRSSVEATQALIGKLGNGGGPVICIGSAAGVKQFKFPARRFGGFEKSMAARFGEYSAADVAMFCVFKGSGCTP